MGLVWSAVGESGVWWDGRGIVEEDGREGGYMALWRLGSEQLPPPRLVIVVRGPAHEGHVKLGGEEWEGRVWAGALGPMGAGGFGWQGGSAVTKAQRRVRPGHGMVLFCRQFTPRIPRPP